jgi:ubiquinone/menaquinone biosynthesis C-methylase UbiE
VKAFYEDLWQRLPPRLDPPKAATRRAHLRAHVRVGDRVLDLGCGDGSWATELRSAGAAAVVGAEIADAALERARARDPHGRWVLVPEDGPLPFADRSFAVVWCSETLEHVGDTAAFLAQARRVLRPEGRFVVTVPAHPRVRTAFGALVGFERRFPPLGDHLRFYTRRSLRDALDDAGFVPGEIHTRDGLLLVVATRPL